MANFIPAYGLGAQLGSQAGSILGAVGQGLGAGIQEQTGNILQDMARRKAETMRAEALRQFMPFASQQELSALASFPEQVQFNALQGGFGQQQPISGLEAVKQMPFSQEQVAALKALPEQQRNQILQKLQQTPQALAKTKPISLGQALQREQQLAGKAGAGPKLSKADEKFDTKVVNDFETAQDIIGILDSIDDILARNNYSYGALADITPNALKAPLFGEDTQALNNLFNALVVKQSAAESQGRGSDLLRKMISEGKLSLGQAPDVMKFVSKRLREEQDKKLNLSRARDMFYDQHGYAPRADQTRQLAARLGQEERKLGSSVLKVGSVIDELPKNVMPGTQVRDSESGNIFEFDGKTWNPVQGA